MPVTVSDIADKLNMTENDILRALKYWNSLKVLKVEYDGSTPVSICLCDLNQPVLCPGGGDSRIKGTCGEQDHCSLNVHILRLKSDVFANRKT